MLKHKLSQSIIEEIIRAAVKIEKSFVCDAIPVALIGMNAALMSKYIEFVADRLIQALGYSKIYNVANPFVSIVRVFSYDVDNPSIKIIYTNQIQFNYLCMGIYIYRNGWK